MKKYHEETGFSVSRGNVAAIEKGLSGPFSFRRSTYHDRMPLITDDFVRVVNPAMNKPTVKDLALIETKVG